MLGCIGSHFYIVFKHDITELRNLFILAVFRGKPESVGTDDGPGVENTVLADDAAVVNRDVDIIRLFK